MKDKEKQINDLANTLYNRQHKYDLSNPFEVAKCVIDLGYIKIDYKNIDNIDLMIFGGKRFEYIPKDSVVLSREEYEMFVNQYKNLEIKYSNLCDNYILCKDENETIKQNAIISRKETAEKIFVEVLDLEELKVIRDMGWETVYNTLYNEILELAKQFGVEIKE